MIWSVRVRWSAYVRKRHHRWSAYPYTVHGAPCRVSERYAKTMRNKTIKTSMECRAAKNMAPAWLRGPAEATSLRMPHEGLSIGNASTISAHDLLRCVVYAALKACVIDNCSEIDELPYRDMPGAYVMEIPSGASAITTGTWTPAPSCPPSRLLCSDPSCCCCAHRINAVGFYTASSSVLKN